MNNGWSEWEQLVLHELERHETRLNEIRSMLDNVRQQDLPQLRTEIALLKLRAGIWGAVAGMIIPVGLLLTSWISKQF